MDMFARCPPKVYFKLRKGLVADHLLTGLLGVSITEAGGLSLAVLGGSALQNSQAYIEITGLLRSHRAGRVVRITVAAAEAAAVADFGRYLTLKSLAQQGRFVVWLKARDRSAQYSIGRTGRIISKKQTASAVLDAYA